MELERHVTESAAAGSGIAVSLVIDNIRYHKVNLACRCGRNRYAAVNNIAGVGPSKGVTGICTCRIEAYERKQVIGFIRRPKLHRV